jgi:mRNA export factor
MRHRFSASTGRRYDPLCAFIIFCLLLIIFHGQDGTKTVSGGADKAARLYDIQSGQTIQVAAHEDTVRCVRMIQAPGSAAEMLVTGSWDKTLKYWDLRQQQAVATLQMQERVYALDVSQTLMVVGTAEKHINIVDLASPTTIFKTIPSPLKWQTRVISCFPEATGFAVGSIEGRCAFRYVDDKNTAYVFHSAPIYTFSS